MLDETTNTTLLVGKQMGKMLKLTSLLKLLLDWKLPPNAAIYGFALSTLHGLRKKKVLITTTIANIVCGRAQNSLMIVMLSHQCDCMNILLSHTKKG